jgi:chromosome segregation ATPase
MTAHSHAESYPGNSIHSLGNGSRDTRHELNDTSPLDGEPRSDGELKKAVSTTQLEQDLRSIGSQLLSIETEQRVLMERLQRIAAQVDERTIGQFEALQREDETARQEILSMREDLEALRASFPEQFETIGNQCESFRRQFRIGEERFRDIEQELRSAEDRVQKTASDANQRFNDTDEQLQATTQQLTDVVGQIKTFESQIKSCEDLVQRTTGLLFETKNTFDEQASRRENVMVSIGALAQQIEQLKADVSEVSVAKLKSFQASLTSTRRMQGLAMLAWIMSLLLVCYIGIGDRGWSVLTQYLSQWMSALFT